MLFCLRCCTRCTVCLDDFERDDSDDIVTGSPTRCEWTVLSGEPAIDSGRLVLNTDDGVVGAQGARVEITVRGEQNSDVAEITLGGVVGLVVFGNPGYFVLTGTDLGFVLETCDLAPGEDHEIELCIGQLESDADQPAVRMAKAGGGCEIGDTIPLALTAQTLGLRSLQGRIEFDRVKLSRGQADEPANLANCPECLAVDPPPPACVVCRDEFNRADNSDITIAATCDWEAYSGGDIETNKLKIPSGESVTGPAGDYVSVSVSAGTVGTVVTISVGGVDGILTLGADSTTMEIAGVGGPSPDVVNPHISAGSGPHTFILCIGQVGNKWGALFYDANAPLMQVSGSLTSPATPYGAIELAASGGTAYFDGVLILVREVEGERCNYCHPFICAICYDDTATLPDFPTTDCGWHPALGSTVDYLADIAGAVAVSTQRNPNGRPVMIVSALWSWTGADAGDVVQIRVATNSSGGNGVKVEAEYGGGFQNGCLRMYDASGALRTQVPYDNSSLLSVACDGEDVWVYGNLTINQMLGLSHTPLPGGGYAAIGVGALAAGHTIEFSLMSIDWYAVAPWHKHCQFSYRHCHITEVGFPDAGAYGIYPSGANLADAGDPAAFVNCNISYTAAAWAADFVNDYWITQTTNASVKLLTCHPLDSVNLNAWAQWYFAVGITIPEDFDFSVYQGLKVKFLHDSGGAHILAEFLGSAQGAAHIVMFHEVTINGSSGITANVQTGNDPFPNIMQACFGETRTRTAFATLGFRDAAGPATGDGCGIGIQAGPTFYGVGGDTPAYLGVKGITLNHSKASTPNNEFTGLDPAECVDCDNNHCEPCEDETPASLKVIMSVKAGADTSAYCAADIAALTGSFTLASHLNDCRYSIYFGPTSKAAVDDYVETINSVDPTEDPVCLRFIGLTMTMGTGGAGVQFTLNAIPVTGGPDPGHNWQGSVALDGFDCSDFSVDLTEAGLSTALSELFDVTVEYP